VTIQAVGGGRDAREREKGMTAEPGSAPSLAADDPLGIIAGGGRFPFLVVDGARRAGCRVTVIGLRGLADPALAARADAFHWSGLVKPGRWIRILGRARIRRVILAGYVHKEQMYGRFRLLRLLPDLTAIRIWFFGLPDRRNDTVLRALADLMARRGIHMEECTRYCPEEMAPEGVLTRRQPSDALRGDAEFGWAIAKQMGHLDIGQSVAVKEREVIAVEAIEGTDRMIERAGPLCPSGGWTLVKVAKPNQDMRFDVPTVGPDTVSLLARCGGRMLVIEAGRTLLIERERFLAEAERSGIIVLARRADP
jgi:hypothetical protein